jgi:hypothetical protein
VLEHPKIEQLRELAKLNLCDKCKPVYTSMIEPGIIGIVKSYFDDWKSIELHITKIIMKLENVYKTDLITTSISYKENKKYNYVDYEKFNKIERWNFANKIKYLKERAILQKHSYALLDLVRLRRNKIHKHSESFITSDFVAFSYGAHITHNIWLSVFGKFDQSFSKRLQEGAEKQAELYCSLIQKIK